MFKFSLRNYKDVYQQRQIFDDVARKMGIQKFEDWYKVKVSDLQKFGGYSIIHGYYACSISKALVKMYPLSRHPRVVIDCSDILSINGKLGGSRTRRMCGMT